jgi:hypothetical protein
MGTLPVVVNEQDMRRSGQGDRVSQRATAPEVLRGDFGRIHGPAQPGFEVTAAHNFSLPVTAEADEILARQGITVIPDILANSGGVIASYFEWTQNLQRVPWTARKVRRELRLRLRLTRMYRKVASVSSARGISFRRAAYLIAVERVARAETLRGLSITP